ncbi:hypothetical protein LAZ67_5000996 [Cordylochernes scorpioides]|uniref:Reverse transcriptase n=1 Tax=Cordylochernes scorpioides TaxID=51811 RepID=A0ABY6KG13_9ARAC|nr:hypothetical protein LAZ67_5000996 [Cordylochernes scorpioides]
MILGKNAQNLEQDTGISKTTIGRIVTKDLKLKKTPAKFIPRFLTNEQKLCRLATCENMLEMTRTDPEWKDKIITGDETWVYDYDPETKRQYAEWRGQGEPRPKKSRILKSRNKVLLVAFLDNKGIVHHEYLPAGQTVIKEMYLDILRHLREAIRKNMPEKWPNGDWILHHNNARPHTAHLVTSFFLAKNGTEILPQPPYSPDIAPNNFFLLPKLKAVLKGRHFDTRDDIIEKSLLALKSIPKELYKNCFDNLGKRWRCLANEKACGADEIPNEALKTLPFEHLVTLKNIFNRIINSGSYPLIWSKSIIHPIFKSGDRDNPSNYRGIALISNLSKLFTSILKSRLRNSIEGRSIIPENQAGFRKGYSCQDHIFTLLSLIQLILRRKRRKLYAFFVDLKKAFDTVPHSLLWSKLGELGLNFRFVNLIRNYFEQMTTTVRWNGLFTEPIKIRSGVLQGEPLSPYLFILFIMVFRNGGRPAKSDKWFWGDQLLTVTSKYLYLGYPLTTTISFSQVASYFKGKALAATGEALTITSLVPEEPSRSAEQVPERPSTGSQPGEELSPKKGIIENSSLEFSMEYRTHASPPAREVLGTLAAARGDVTAPPTAASSSENLADPASLNWADSEMAEVDANDDYTVVKSKKRRLSSTPEHAAKQASRPAEKRGPQQQKRTTGPRSMPPQEIKATRANIADARARQASTNHENYVFVELCPDIPDYSYLKAMSTLLGGPKSITQFHRMNGHFIVGLADKELANRLVADGLEIEGTSLRVFPFRKRAERIIVANLPGFVEDSTIATALGQFGNVTSIAPILVKMGEFTFTDGRREAFILLREGVRLETLPTLLTIHSKGDTLSAFLSFGIKCSKCGKQGHRRANCPALARQGNGSPRQAASPTDARPPLPPPQRPRKPAPAPATPASPVQPAKTSAEAIPSAHQPAEQMDLTHPAPAAHPAPLATLRPPEPRIPPLDQEMSVEKLSSPPATPARGKAALEQLLEHLEKSPNPSIDWDKLPDLNCEEAQKLLTSETTMKKRAPTLTVAQVAALNNLHDTIKALCPDSNSTIRKTLQKTRKETNAFHLGSGQDLCLGYGAVVLAHPVAISGSGLACVFGPGVAVLQQRILWPGHIALATIDVHGEEMTAIAVHLAHEPRERNQQLELLAATAAQEEEGACWIIGDFNIRDRGPSSSSSSDALAALLDLAALVDVATQFDAAHLPTRVSMHGDQVESNRLDRILVPAGVLDRVSIYATSHYHLSDHRLVLLQLEEDTAHDGDDGTFWDRWTSIKAGLLAEARSLHDPRNAANDSYVYRARRYIAAQLEASSIRADYPSLPDLARAIRLRRPVSVIRDEQDNIIEGPELRRRAFATFQPRFARPTSDPAAGAAFIASSAPTTTRELSEEDPLNRPDISPSEIANAIEHLPRGKAPGWDGLPCELLVAFSEDFFAEALARVFAASRLRGALPPSTRRSSICLVPKARGGRGLDGYRPVALPSADYRVLAAILHRRLKPHLRTLVPECQTYAVPGRSPSWNIAMVTDAIEEATALGSPLAVMGVDLESAFDSLDRGFLESLLTSLRLPPAFMAWINILYAGADATIRVGGFHTTAFPLLNSLRQGCAVSAALFSIATGPLLRRLELTLGVGNVIAYADDIVLLFHRDGDFERVATVFEDYRQASGIGVNLRKSAGLWCGAWRNRGDSPLGASWSTTSIRVLGLDIAPRSTVIQREQHLLALLETACRKWTPFTRGLSLVGRARATNTLVGSVIQHHLHGYLPSPPTIAKLQARLARFVWGQDHTAWLPANVMARPVAIGGLGLLDLATQLQLACLKGVQVALRGGRNAFSWLVGGNSGEAWIHPPPDGTRLQPRRLRLLKLWEEASNILGLNHRAVPTAQLLDLPIIGGCRFLRPPDLLAPARWRGARVRDLIVEENLIARPTRSALADAATLGAFCRRLTSENAVGFGAESTPSSSSLAAAVVLRGTATPFLNGLTTRSARRALDRPRLAATPISRFLARWTPTINPPSRIDWASLRRCAYSGHEADAALKLALHALPHPAHPASVGPSCPACGSIDRSLGHRYWCCRSIRPLIREAFNIIGRPPDPQAWIFGGSSLEDDVLSILASAKLRIYRYFVQVGLGEAVEDPLIAWSRTLQRRVPEETSRSAEQVPERPSTGSQPGEDLSLKKGIIENSSLEFSMEYRKHASPPAREVHGMLAAARGYVTAPPTAAFTSATTASPGSLNWADSDMAEVDANDGYTVVKGKKRRRGSTSPEHAARQPNKPGEQRSSQQRKRPTGPRAVPPQEIKATRADIADAKARQATTNHENYVFVELCPDIPDYSYLRAIRMLLGGPKGITQFNKMNGHYIVGLANKNLANRLVADGLEIEGTSLKVFPFRKRAERIVVAYLPGFVEDSTIVNVLSQFGKVTSIAPILVKMGEFTSTDGRREAFILLREGVRLETLPTRLTIESKGDTLSLPLFWNQVFQMRETGPPQSRLPSARQAEQQPQASSVSQRRKAPSPSSSSAAKEAGTGARNTGVPFPTGEDINRGYGDPLGAPSCRTDGSRPARPPCSPGCPAAPRASHLSARPRDVGGEADLTSLHACPGRIRTQTAAEAHRGDPHPFHRLGQAARP